MRYFIALVIMVIGNISAYSQTGKISGYINEEGTNKDAPFCNVVLFDFNDSIIEGTISNEKGIFRFENLSFGTYYLSFQSLTHEIFVTKKFTLSIKSPSKDFGTVPLKVSSIKTDEVTISVERTAVKIEPAKKTFDVETTGADIGGTAIDVLNNLPSVDVDDDGNVSLRGNSNIRVLIDGKPAGLTPEDITAVIKQLPANAIETIEIITVPSAKYDPEGIGGIINIKLKKERRKGYRGSVSLSYSTIDKLNSQVSLNLNKKKWSINTSYNYTDGTYWYRRSNNGIFLESDILTAFDNYSKTNKRTANQNGNLNLEYKISKSTKVSFEGSLRNTYSRRIDSLEFYWDYNGLDNKSNTRNSDYEEFRKNALGQLNLSYKNKKGNSVTFLSRMNGISNPKESHFVEPYILQKENKNFKAQAFINQLDFEFPIINNKKDSSKSNFLFLETGFKSAARKFSEEYELFNFNPSFVAYELQEEYTNILDYDEEIYAAYGLFKSGNKFNKLSTGIRVEYSDITSRTKNNNFNKTLINIFPSASLVHNLSETTTIALNYSKRIKRPRGKQLNPIPTYLDPYTLRVGNADLVPEKSHMSEISYLKIGKKIVFNSTLFHQYRKDRLGRLSYTDSNAVSTILWINFNYHQTLGLELFTNYKLNKKIKINSSGTFYNTWVDGENFRVGFTAVYFGYDLKLNLQIKPWKSTAFTLTSDYNSRRLAVVGIVIPRYGTDVSLKHNVFGGKGTLSLRFTDVFFTRRFGIDVNTDGWLREVRYRYESQLLWFGFNYSFGQSSTEGKSKFRRVSPNERSF